MATTSFTTPNDYSVEQGQIERRRALSQALQQQSMQDIPQQTAGGWTVRNSPLQGAARIAQAYAAKKNQEKADTQQQQLVGRVQGDYQRMLSQGLSQLSGTSGRTIQPDPQEAQQSADQGTPQVGPVTQAAQAPDPMAALGTFGSHPMGQQFAPLAMKQIQDQQRQQTLAKLLQGGQPGAQPSAASAGATGGGASGGFASGIPQNIMGMMTSGDPEIASLGKALLEANKGVAQRPGAPVVNPFTGAVIAQPTPAVPPGIGLQVGPGGTQAFPVPGAQGAMASLTQSQAGATEAGKAPYQLSTYNTPGAPRVMTHQQAIEAATGSPMPQPGQPPQAQASQGLPANVPQQDASAFQYVQDQARQGRPAQALGNSQYSGPKAPGMPLQDQGESAQQTHAGAEVGKFFGDTYASLQRGAMDASGKLTRLSRMESLLKDVETGKLTPAGTNVAAYAKSLGIDIDPKLDNKQAAEALTNEIALQARNPSGGAGMPGALSDSDRNFLSSMTPGLAKTPGAREMIMETSRKLAKRDQEVAKLAREYYKKNGNTLDNGFFDELQNFSNANPLFKDATTPGGNQMFATNPNTKERIVSSDGGQTWKPAQ